MVIHHIGGQALSVEIGHRYVDCVDESDMNALYSDYMEGLDYRTVSLGLNFSVTLSNHCDFATFHWRSRNVVQLQ